MSQQKQPMTIADAKQELEQRLNADARSVGALPVSMTVHDASGTRERTGTMTAVRNEKGGIDYSVDVDPIDLAADASGV